ncbi:hypothetical protein FHETE_10056 [Fusarium heterosporum]|uniref:Uncharacterized protein n=1 Tax=Fusarium heterosporum TaxID=42747 RepID=A0A8H5SV00_FUSHE|nr:hypothetical protein FHETE_10056 [Fusarium heterosporum]
MRLTIPFITLCVVQAVVGLMVWPGMYDRNKKYAHHSLKDKEQDHGLDKHNYKTHEHKHKHLHPHEHIHHEYHKHPIKPCHILTAEKTCKDFNGLADHVEKVIDVVNTKDCGNDESCWHVVVQHLYDLEYSLDKYDRFIDKTSLQKCFNCEQETTVVKCYHNYADALIRLLKDLKHKSKYLEGEVDRPVLTAINSLRSANYALTYEFGRRINCKTPLKYVMEKQGANDGTTKGSVQEAFKKFVYTPLVTGDDFKNKGSYEKNVEDENKDDKYKGGEKKDGDKNAKVYKHHHEHYHGYKDEHDNVDGHKHHYEQKKDYEHKQVCDGKQGDCEHKADPHYHHHNVRDLSDPSSPSADYYLLGSSNERYFENPSGNYRDRLEEEAKENYLAGYTERNQELGRQQFRYSPYYQGGFKKANNRYHSQEPPKWYPPGRSPYNHYHGNRRWD